MGTHTRARTHIHSLIYTLSRARAHTHMHTAEQDHMKGAATGTEQHGAREGESCAASTLAVTQGDMTGQEQADMTHLSSGDARGHDWTGDREREKGTRGMIRGGGGGGLEGRGGSDGGESGGGEGGGAKQREIQREGLSDTQNTFYSKRTHSIVREHILQREGLSDTEALSLLGNVGSTNCGRGGGGEAGAGGESLSGNVGGGKVAGDLYSLLMQLAAGELTSRGAFVWPRGCDFEKVREGEGGREGGTERRERGEERRERERDNSKRESV